MCAHIAAPAVLGLTVRPPLRHLRKCPEMAMDVKTGAAILARSVADDVLHKLMQRQDISLHAVIDTAVLDTLLRLAEAQGWANWPMLNPHDDI